MTTRHTPGPWEIAEDDVHGQAVVRGEHTEIATCWHHCVGSIEIEMRANARLIAAAPDLLAALQMLMDLIELSGPRRIAPHKSPIEAVRAPLGKAEYEAARAAIKKAKGE